MELVETLEFVDVRLKPARLNQCLSQKLNWMKDVAAGNGKLEVAPSVLE